ncbi:hypothetical protein RI129_002266 [Pyrocoelia pectoralis]|uniref:PHD-type domain-containing protein n=1 Tax=Pyrocoelia pectoralis TaxID=417401 RepID=A0AAN7VP96_9COLE
MSLCNVCEETFLPESDFVHCEGCNSNIHYLCSGVRETTFRKLTIEAKLAWRCGKCKVKAYSSADTQFEPKPDIINAGMLSIITLAVKEAIKEETKLFSDKLDAFQQSLDFYHDQIGDLKKLICEKDKRLDECFSTIDKLNSDNVNLKKENFDAKQRINRLEQYSRLNCVEIRGVPEPRDENVLSTVAAVGRVLNFPLDKSMVDACHRLVSNQSRPQEPRRIILKFISRIHAEEFLKARKIKRNFSTKDLDPSSGTPSPIYVNEFLSPEYRRLYYQCREFKKSNNVKFLWVKSGKIMMRKTENSRVYVINSTSDFTDVH